MSEVSSHVILTFAAALILCLMFEVSVMLILRFINIGIIFFCDSHQYMESRRLFSENFPNLKEVIQIVNPISSMLTAVDQALQRLKKIKL